MTDLTTHVSTDNQLSPIPNQIKKPNQSVNTFLSEADYLYKWCLPDKPNLIAAGLEEALFDLFPEQIEQCRKAQIVWVNYFKSENKLQTNWKQQSTLAFDLRDTLLADFKFAFRNNPARLEQIVETAKRTTISQKIQDLNDLAVLGSYEIAALAAINFDTNKLEQAAAFSPQLSSLYALTRNERKKTNELLLVRNQSYTALWQTVSEIRKCGVYVFRKDKTRQQGYRDEQRRKRYLKQTAKKQLAEKNTKEE